MASRNCHGFVKQLLTKKIKDFAGVRYFCTDASKFCMIIGENGPIAYEASQFQEWDEYVKTEPILKLIPTNGLYGSMYDPIRSYHMNDEMRPVLRSGALAVRNANLCGLSVINPFKLGNVGIVKPLGCMAFKCLQLDPDREWEANPSTGYYQLSSFLRESILNTHSISALSDMPIQMETYLKDIEKKTVDVNLIIDHPSTLPNLVYNDTCLEAFWFLKKERSAPANKLDEVLISVGLGQPDAFVNTLNHQLLHQFLPSKLQSMYPAHRYPFTNMYRIPLSHITVGEVIVEVNRHTLTHCMDSHVKYLVQSRLNVASYSREDWTELLRVAYPNFIRDAYNQSATQGILEKLKVRERLPIPSIYLAPPSAVVSFRCVLVFLRE